MFSKKELQIFLFSWLQTFKRSFLIFIKYFWWLVALEIGFKLYTSPPMIVHALTSMLTVYFSVLSIRASIETKNFLYFFINLKKFAIFAVLYVLFFIAFHSTIALTALVPIFIIATFFFLDSDFDTMNIWRAWGAIYNACRGLLAYFPPFIFIAALYLISQFTMTFLFSLFPSAIAIRSIAIPGTTTLNFFFTCAIAILYLKIKHESPQLFRQKSR